MKDLENPTFGVTRRFESWVREHSKIVLLAAAFLILALWALRAYIPALGGSLLPPSVMDSIERGYRVCIMDIDIQPGETRQPSCGDVRVVAQAQGSVPAQQAQAGITRAVCYKVEISIPYWTTDRVTRHEVVFHGRRVSKVALQMSGKWVTFSDNDREDGRRWEQFGCTTRYEVGATPDPGSK